MNTCHICGKTNIKRLDVHLKNTHQKEFSKKRDQPVEHGNPKKQKMEHNFKEGRYVVVKPLTMYKDGSQLEMVYHGNDGFVDLSKTLLRVVLKVVHSDGTSIGDAPKVALVQAIHSTLWKNIEVQLNNKRVDNPLYAHYLNYMHLLLETDQHTKNTIFKAGGYMPLKDRRTKIKKSGNVEFFCPLLSDLFLQDKPLPPNIDMRVILNAASAEFALISDEADDAKGYKIELSDVELHLKIMEPVDSVQIPKPVELKFERRIIQAPGIAQGSQRHVIQSAFQGESLPTKVYLALTDAVGFGGKSTIDPFIFKGNGVKSISVSKAGIDVMGPPYLPGDSLVREYILLSEVTKTNGITLEEYESNCTIFGFQVTPNHAAKENGDVAITIEFNEALKTPLTLLVVGVFERKLKINDNEVIVE